MAARAGHTEVVEFLLRSGASATEEDKVRHRYMCCTYQRFFKIRKILFTVLPHRKLNVLSLIQMKVHGTAQANIKVYVFIILIIFGLMSLGWYECHVTWSKVWTDESGGHAVG